MSVAAAKFSATQIKKFASCPRQWGWEYLEGLHPPQGAAAALGVRCHKLLERWLKKGTVPDPKSVEGKIVMPALKLLPKPSAVLEVERSFLFEFDGHLYRGFVDLGYWSESGLWVVHDHKTTGDFMWALTEEDLLHDVQAILYGKEALDRHDVDEVILSWLYIRTRGAPKTEPRVTVIKRDEVDSGMQVIQHYADQMSAHRRMHLPVIQERRAEMAKRLKIPSETPTEEVQERTQHQPGEPSPVLTLDYNAYTCSQFGGCAFQDRCKLTRRERMRSIMAQSNKKESLKERMARRKQERGGEETPRAVAKAAPEINPPEKDVEDEQEETTSESAANDQAGDKVEEKAEDKAAKRRGRGRASKPKEEAKEEKPKEEAQEETATDKRRPGRPTGSTNKPKVDFAPERAFVSLFAAAIAAGGEDRHWDAAVKAWAMFKKEFED